MNLSNVDAFVSKDIIRMGLIESQSDHVCQESFETVKLSDEMAYMYMRYTSIKWNR